MIRNAITIKGWASIRTTPNTFPNGTQAYAFAGAEKF